METVSNASLPKGVRLGLYLVLAVVVILLDQWTKGMAVAQLEYGRPVAVLPILNFTLQYNPGAAFSFLSDAGGWQRWFFSGVAAVVSLVILVWLTRLKSEEWMVGLSLSLILAGAVCNLWDRLVLGHVVDFISVHYEGSYFPAFNVADSSITVGAVLMILDAILQSRREAAVNSKEAQ